MLTVCRNCGASLSPAQHYCADCGQHAATERITLHEISHELLHAVFHVDRSVFSLLRLLVLKPGIVSREYVAGRRKRYFGPFAFLIIVVGVATAVVALSGITLVISGDDKRLAQAVQHHVNLGFLAQVPLLAAYARLLFFRQRFNFAENLVLASYATSMRTLLFVIVIVPIFYLYHPSTLDMLHTYYVYSLCWLVYFGFACSQFFVGHRAVLWIKGMATAALTQATLLGLITLLSAVF